MKMKIKKKKNILYDYAEYKTLFQKKEAKIAQFFPKEDK